MSAITGKFSFLREPNMAFPDFITAASRIRPDPQSHRLALWLRYFDSEFYRTHPHCNGVPDLIDKTTPELYWHFVERGWREGRSFSRILHTFLDPAFYMQCYPHLNLANPADAVRHWMYEGHYEGRLPNLGTKKVMESDIHLFQFGKVGSRSIEGALYGAGYDKMVVHLHWASDLIATHSDCFYSYEEVVSSTAFRSRPLRFIAGVRDPIERAISGYFESSYVRNSNYSVEETIAAITNTVLGDQMDLLLSWFDHQFFSRLDVYAYPFNKDAGYTVIEHDGVSLFLYRLKNLPDLARPISQFVGLELKLDRLNCSADKPYAGLYREAIKSIRFPGPIVHRIITSRMVSQFFTDDEIQQMYDRWTV